MNSKSIFSLLLFLAREKICPSLQQRIPISQECICILRYTVTSVRITCDGVTCEGGSFLCTSYLCESYLYESYLCELPV